jgi:hypothetical protein
MPVARYTLSGVARGLKAFLTLEAGMVRDASSGIPSLGPQPREPGGPTNGQETEIRRLRGLVAARDRELADLRTRSAGARPGGVRPENIIWIFGTGRSGNTWFSSMMGEMGHAVWREPSVGRLFGEFYYFGSRKGQRGTGNFVLGEKQRDTWVRSIRNFVLEGANGRFPHLEGGYLVIKEQVGSVGAPLLMQALPESKMIMLIRDSRDVVASWANATRRGGWRYERLSKSDHDWKPLADEDPDAFVEERANHYLRNVSKAEQAYEEHEGHKVMVRYEDLRADTIGTMKRVYSQLALGVDEEELSRVVKKHAWENVPEEEKGEGKFHGKGRYGSWREDLTPEQAKTVERITAPLLEKYYSG